MADYQHIETRREGATLVATLTNRVEQEGQPPSNLMNARMVAELTSLASDLRDDEDVRVLVLTGGVEDVFITHYDVTELSGLSERMQTTDADPGGGELHGTHRMLLALEALPQPVIAAINGTAMGGGCELALACDFRYMAKGSYSIGLPEVRVGILPGAGGTQRLTRLLGAARALELMLPGRVVDPETAERIGLVHRAVEPDRLLTEALAFADELAKLPRLSVALIKRLVYEGSEKPLTEALRLEQDAFWQTMRSDDARRLMRDYLNSGRSLDQA